MYQLQPRQWNVKTHPTNMLREVVDIATARIHYIESSRPRAPYCMFPDVIPPQDRLAIQEDLRRRTEQWRTLRPYTKLLVCPLARAIIYHRTDRTSWEDHELTRCFDLGHMHVGGTCINVEVQRVMKHEEGLVTLL